MIIEGISKIVTHLLNPSTGMIAELTVLGHRFQLIRFQGESLKKAQWQPGDKIQISLDLSRRTYTPLSWNIETGESEILAYSHTDQSKASLWLKSLKTNESFHYFGPRRSLLINELGSDLLFFGDETSFGVAHALKMAKPGEQNIPFFFEVSDKIEASKLLSCLHVEPATLIAKETNELQQLAQNFVIMLNDNPDATLVLTGRASSIQTLRKILRDGGILMKRITVKAYWADGKKGLD